MKFGTVLFGLLNFLPGYCNITCCVGFIIPHLSNSASIISKCQKNAIRNSEIVKSYGWLDNFLPAPIEQDDSKRRKEYPEQYPATYELNKKILPEDGGREEFAVARKLLKQTMLEERPLQIVYDTNQHDWDAASFHRCVDGKGAAIVMVTYKRDDVIKIVGGYNPKGWSSNGGARPSVAAFLFYEIDHEGDCHEKIFQKLQKVGGGGLACARDDPDYGISFGPDALVISLQEGREKIATSKLGPYYERGPDNISTLFAKGAQSASLEAIQVLTGIYDDDEEIPYSGAVLDMTSG